MAILVLWLCLVIQPSSSRRSRHFCEHGYLWTAAGGRVAFALLSCSCDTWPAFYVYGGCGGPFAAGGPTPVFMTLPCAYHFLATSRFVSAWPYTLHTPSFLTTDLLEQPGPCPPPLSFCPWIFAVSSGSLVLRNWAHLPGSVYSWLRCQLSPVLQQVAVTGVQVPSLLPILPWILATTACFVHFRDFNSPRCYFLGVCHGHATNTTQRWTKGCSKRCTGHMQLASAVGR